MAIDSPRWLREIVDNMVAIALQSALFATAVMMLQYPSPSLEWHRAVCLIRK
ncbi:unnamed protein product [Somion occarium]|uniref:Uncharacterized protein n=1 Tax=Somion occarium TaxID=3059160 RepID=A0ABP1DS69_9APHY